MKTKKYIKNITGMTTAGMATGAGIQGVHAVGGDTSALSTMSGYFPAMGNVTGAGMVMDSMQGISKMHKKKRRSHK